MLNVIWLGMILIAVVVGAIHGRTTLVVAAVTDSAKMAFELGLSMAGIMALWLGIMKIAEDAHLIHRFATLLKPLMAKLFPDVPADHPAMGSMVLNMSANLLGLTNAATPFGLKAMQDLNTLNKQPGTATNAMCTFLAINTSSIQLIPTTAIALLAAGGATDPSIILVSALLATTCSTITGISAAKILEKCSCFRLEDKESGSCLP